MLKWGRGFAVTLRSESGMSLAGVMVAAGVLAILVMVIAEIFKVSNVSFQQVRMSNDLQTVQNLIQMSLADPDICRQALEVGGVTLNDYSYPYQDPPSPKVDLSDIKMNGKTLLSTLGGYTIKPKLYSPEAPGGIVKLIDRADNTLKTFHKYSVIIMLNGVRSDDSSGIVSMRARVPMTIITGPDPASPTKFYDCSSTFQDYKAMCEVLGGEYNGNKTPPCLLKRVGLADTFDNREKLNSDASAQATTLHLQSSSDNGLNLILSNKAESTYWLMGKRSDAYAGSPKNLFFSYWNGVNWAQAMDIKDNGNVGIGTPSPGADVAMTGGLTVNGTGWTQMTIQKNGVSGFALNSSNSTLGDWSMFDRVNGAWNLSLTSNQGNIGIGATDPSQRLDVNGYVRVRSTNGEGGTIQLDGNNAKKMFVENTNGDFRLVNDPWNAELFRVTQDGRVGVGTGDPKTKLDINGELRVATSGMACAADKDGAVRYNTSDKVMEYCDGTDWLALGGSMGNRTGTTISSAKTNANGTQANTFTIPVGAKYIDMKSQCGLLGKNGSAAASLFIYAGSTEILNVSGCSVWGVSDSESSKIALETIIPIPPKATALKIVGTISGAITDANNVAKIDIDFFK